MQQNTLTPKQSKKFPQETQKSDIYGRYIGHIFYDPTNQKSNAQIFQNGIYLNEEILQKEMGVMI